MIRNQVILLAVDFDQFVKAAGHISEYWLGFNEPPPSRPEASR